MITHVDDEVARVLAAMERLGLADNTVLAFLADHGEYLGAHQLLYKCIWPYEELYRVPFVWKAPGCPGGTVVDSPVSLLDVVPTVLDYAGIGASRFDLRRYGKAERPTLPGRSLRPFIDAPSARPCTDGRTPAPDRPILVEYDEDGRPGPMVRMRTVITAAHKLTVFAGQDQGILFDLAADPHETVNRWNDPACLNIQADLLAQLACELARTDRLDVARISGA